MLPVQCKMARVALGWGVRDVAKMARVSPDTIARLERGEQLKSETVEKIRRVFESAAIHFVEGSHPGVTLATVVLPPEAAGSRYIFRCRHRGQELIIEAPRKLIDRFVSSGMRASPGARPDLSMVAAAMHKPIAAVVVERFKSGQPLNGLVLSKTDLENDARQRYPWQKKQR
jgi:transcriptional regulator with XRE-family HTH domain